MTNKCGIYGEFPVWALLPRKETGVVNFLSKNAPYDGRGTVIAIFDSGVDPAAPGLQITSDGKVKVIDVINASGAGDVDTSVVVKPVDGYITGISGRKLEIPSEWVNPSGEYHIGIKSAFSLYPKVLEDRITKERKEKIWNPHHKQHLANAQEDHQKCIQKAEPSSKSNGNEKEKDTLESSSQAFFDKLAKESAEAKVTLLNNLEKKYKDYGPSYDCVVFNDGKLWRVCIDTSEKGDLKSGVYLGEYIKTQEHTFLTPADQYTVSVNVYNEGNKLEIAGMCTSHGTHVASIASAYFPDSPEKNGVAPGAQIVSISIGDNRLGSMETMSAIIRAMGRVMHNPHYKVDIINMSYGEHPHTIKFGRFGEIAHDVVNKFGVIWIASASNSGPALSTIGTPPDMRNDSIIGVGAYVSPDMMTAEYSMVEKLPGSPYTWSSRGPTIDGGRGVSICAPGGAITSVPCYTLCRSQLMNGTSMSAPHTTGAFALIVSGLKDRKIRYSPYSVRRAVENTALYLDVDPFAQGHGLLQVDKAFDHLCTFVGGVEDHVRIVVECGSDSNKGIHLRNWDADRVVECVVSVQPFMLNELEAEPKDKLSFDMEFVLVCDAPWVKFPPCLQMSYVSRSFKVFIDPQGLTIGSAYMTSVKAYLANRPEKGHIFEVPITVIIPHKEYVNNNYFSSSLQIYRPGGIRRTFFKVPLEATWANVILKSNNTKIPMKFTLHVTQIRPHCSITDYDFSKRFDLSPNEPRNFTVSVKGGYTLELCLAKWWSCAVDGEAEFSIEFHGISPSDQTISLVCSDHIQRVDVRVGFCREEIVPVATLKQLAQTYSPSDSKIEVLGGERDTLPHSKPIYQLILTYSFQISKSGLEVTPKFSLLNDLLYESPFGSQLYMLFDSNKCLLLTGDAYCEKYCVKLDKGEYTIRLHVRHDKVDLLEKLTEMPITVFIKLPQEIKLDIYQSDGAAVVNGKKLQSRHLNKGNVLPVYIASPNLSDKNVKNLGIAVGHSLLGSITFAKDEIVRKNDAYPLRVFITDYPLKKKSSNDDKKEEKNYTDYIEATKDLKASWISKLDRESGQKLFVEALEAYPDCNTIKVAHLQALYDDGSYNDDVITLSKQIIVSIDTYALLAFYGTKTDNRPDSSKHKTQMDRQRGWLLDALSKQGLILLKNLKENKYSVEYEDITNIAIEMLKFVDATDTKVFQFFTKFYLYHNLNGLACRLISRQCEEKYTKENEEKLVEVYGILGWNFAATMVESFHPVRFPKTYTLF